MEEPSNQKANIYLQTPFYFSEQSFPFSVNSRLYIYIRVFWFGVNFTPEGKTHGTGYIYADPFFLNREKAVSGNYCRGGARDIYSLSEIR